MAYFQYVGKTLKNLFTKPATEKFPAQPREYRERYRGHIENDISKCILCGMCMRNCPSSAITVARAAYTWEIHPFSCVQCNKCVEVCPVKCLSMVNSFTEPGSEKTVIVNRYSDEKIEAEKAKAKAAAERAAAARKAAAEKAAAAKAAAEAASAKAGAGTPAAPAAGAGTTAPAQKDTGSKAETPAQAVRPQNAEKPAQD